MHEQQELDLRGRAGWNASNHSLANKNKLDIQAIAYIIISDE